MRVGTRVIDRLREMVLASAACLWGDCGQEDGGLEALKAWSQEESFLVRAAGFTSLPASLGSTQQLMDQRHL